jgi:hypothetical protein
MILEEIGRRRMRRMLLQYLEGGCQAAASPVFVTCHPRLSPERAWTHTCLHVQVQAGAGAARELDFAFLTAQR